METTLAPVIPAKPTARVCGVCGSDAYMIACERETGAGWMPVCDRCFAPDLDCLTRAEMEEHESIADYATDYRELWGNDGLAA